MDNKASSMLFLALLLFSSTSSSAFDISKLLDKYPNLSNFNKHLKDTKLADQINSRSTITVLALDNGAVSSVSGKSQDLIKKILAAHVVLDYYDTEKISKLSLSKKTTTLTTLFQASGQATGEQGFIKVGLINEGEVAFGSAVKGASMNAKLVDSVTSLPYNISVLQISEAIQIPGVNGDVSSSPAAAPSPSKTAKSPSPSTEDEEVVEAPAPSDDEDIASPPEEGELSPEEAPVPVVGALAPASAPTAAPPASSAASQSAEMAVGAIIMGLVSVLVA